MNAQEFTKYLFKIDACGPAIIWAEGKSADQAWKECHRADWMLWWLGREKVDIKKRILAKALCAKTVIHLMLDDRSKNAVEVAEKFGRGLATISELERANIIAGRVLHCNPIDNAAALSAYYASEPIYNFSCAQVASEAAAHSAVEYSSEFDNNPNTEWHSVQDKALSEMANIIRSVIEPGFWNK